MEKLISILCLLLVCTVLTLPALATNAAPIEDSFHIPQDILQMLPLKHGDEVICVYSEPLYYAFYMYDSIDALLDPNTGASVTRYYCVKSADGTFATYRIHNGELIAMDMVLQTWDDASRDLETQRLKRIDPNITIHSTYYLSGAQTEGNAVYYKTSLGDYVYYENIHDTNDYLFSIEAFCAFQSAVYRENKVMNLKEPLVGGIYDNLWDLSDYDISSDNFDPHAKFPLKNKDYTYYYPLAQVETLGIFILLLGLAILLTLLCVGNRRPAVLQTKKRYYIGHCLAVLILVLLLDYTFGKSLLVRDFTSNFLTKGMDRNTVMALVGTPHRDVGNKYPIMEYRLFHDFYFYVRYDDASTVTEILEYEVTYPLRGWLLPALAGTVALGAVIIYLVTHKRSKRLQGRQANALGLRLGAIWIWTVLGLILFDQLVIRGLFPECHVYEGMQLEQLYATMGDFGKLLPGTDTREFSLLFGRTLTVNLEAHYLESKVISCNISGFGNSSYLHYVLPVSIIAVTVGFGVYYLCKRKLCKEECV